MRDSSLDYQAMCRGMAAVNGFDLKKMREEVKREREEEEIEEENARKKMKKEEVKGMLQLLQKIKSSTYCTFYDEDADQWIMHAICKNIYTFQIACNFRRERRRPSDKYWWV